MKTILPFTLALGLAQGAFAQQAELFQNGTSHTAAAHPETNVPSPAERVQVMRRQAMPALVAPSAKEARRFDLNFRGGPPEILIYELREQAGVSVNAIIPEDVADTQIPAMSVKNVTLKQLFDAIEAAGRKTTLHAMSTARSSAPGRPPLVNYQSFEAGYGFRTVGEPGDDAIWHFYREDPPAVPEPRPVRVVRFHQLGLYLGAYEIDDIVTAIRTGWELLEVEDLPTLKFHEETRLLIAVGDPELLETIDEVLRQLQQGLATRDPVTQFTQPAR